MSKREFTIQMVNTLPENKLDIVSAFIQFLYSQESGDYIEELRHSIQQADNGQIVSKSLEELKAMEN
ncbi:MAG: hypothetical protein J1E62_03050 [Lachnospiraceae bacterium]|nr:hypothetical protein [Lachnospiraceae bacterium]